MPYSFNENINPENAFRYVPIPEIDLSSLLELEADWLTNLALVCRCDATALTRHTEDAYAFKEDLLATLSIVYHRLKGDLNAQLGSITLSEKESIISKIKEEIEACTPGFHNRVNSIYQSFKHPKDLAQLLFKVRTSLVQTVATQLTREVHTYNHCLVVANAAGLGVEPLLKKDPHHGNLIDEDIHAALEKTFKSKYHAFYLPFLLCDALRSVLSFLGYEGRAAVGDGYAPEGTVKKVTDCIRGILGQPDLTWRALFLVTGEEGNTYEEGTPEEKAEDDKNLTDDEKVEKGNGPFIKDLDWQKLTRLFFEALKEQEIIRAESKPNTLLEHCYFSRIFSGEVNVSAVPEYQFLEEKDIDTLAAVLELLQEFDPREKEDPLYFENILKVQMRKNAMSCEAVKTFIVPLRCLEQLRNSATRTSFKELASHLPFLVKILPDGMLFFEKFFKKRLSNISMRTTEGRRLASKTLLELVVFLTDCAEFLDATIVKNLLTQKITWIDGGGFSEEYTVLTLAARHQPEVVQMLLTWAVEHPEILNADTLKEWLLQKTAEGYTVLTLAARYQPEVVKMFLTLAVEHSEILNADTLKKLLLQKTAGGYTVLAVAAQCQPEVVKMFFTLAVEHPEILNVDTLKELLLQKTGSGYTVLTVAAKYQPEVVQMLLTWAVEYPEILNADTLKEWLLQKTGDGYTVLMYAAACQPEVFKILFTWAVEHPEILNADTLKELLLQKTDEGSTALTLAAHHQPEVVKMLLTLAVEHPEILNADTLKKLLLQKTAGGSTALTLAAQYQPEVVKILLTWAVEHPEILNADTLKKLLLQKVPTGGTVLSVAVGKKHELVELVIMLAITHRDLFSDTLNLLLQRNYWEPERGHSGSSFEFVTRYQPEVFKIFLEFAVYYPDRLDMPDLEILLTRAIESPSETLKPGLLGYLVAKFMGKNLEIFPESLVHCLGAVLGREDLTDFLMTHSRSLGSQKAADHLSAYLKTNNPLGAYLLGFNHPSSLFGPNSRESYLIRQELERRTSAKGSCVLQ